MEEARRIQELAGYDDRAIGTTGHVSDLHKFDSVAAAFDIEDTEGGEDEDGTEARKLKVKFLLRGRYVKLLNVALGLDQGKDVDVKEEVLNALAESIVRPERNIKVLLPMAYGKSLVAVVSALVQKYLVKGWTRGCATVCVYPNVALMHEGAASFRKAGIEPFLSKDIEGFRRHLARNGHGVVVSVIDSFVKKMASGRNNHLSALMKLGCVNRLHLDECHELVLQWELRSAVFHNFCDLFSAETSLYKYLPLTVYSATLPEQLEETVASLLCLYPTETSTVQIANNDAQPFVANKNLRLRAVRKEKVCDVWEEIVTEAEKHSRDGVAHMIACLAVREVDEVVRRLGRREVECLKITGDNVSDEGVAGRTSTWLKGEGTCKVVVTTQPVNGLNHSGLFHVSIAGSWNLITARQVGGRAGRMKGQVGNVTFYYCGEWEEYDKKRRNARVGRTGYQEGFDHISVNEEGYGKLFEGRTCIRKVLSSTGRGYEAPLCGQTSLCRVACGGSIEVCGNCQEVGGAAAARVVNPYAGTKTKNAANRKRSLDTGQERAERERARMVCSVRRDGFIASYMGNEAVIPADKKNAFLDEGSKWRCMRGGCMVETWMSKARCFGCKTPKPGYKYREKGDGPRKSWGEKERDLDWICVCGNIYYGSTRKTECSKSNCAGRMQVWCEESGHNNVEESGHNNVRPLSA